MSAVADTYAETLLELGLRDGAAETYGEALAVVAGLYRDERAFRLFLETPRVEASRKKELLREVLGGRTPEVFVRFLLVVLEKRRQGALPAMARAYRELLDERRGRVRARITLAVEPDEELEREISERLGELLGREVVPRFEVDEEIVGGLVVRVGDRVLDSSIRRRLQELRRDLTAGATET